MGRQLVHRFVQRCHCLSPSVRCCTVQNMILRWILQEVYTISKINRYTVIKKHLVCPALYIIILLPVLSTRHKNTPPHIDLVLVCFQTEDPFCYDAQYSAVTVTIPQCEPTKTKPWPSKASAQRKKCATIGCISISTASVSCLIMGKFPWRHGNLIRAELRTIILDQV